MKTLLSVILGAAGFLFAPAAFADDGASEYASSEEAPPVAQVLVREGEFAVELAAMLDLGTPAEEATAEDLLAEAGVAPANGWISDYPMTPQIVGQLDEALSKAAGEGRIPMTAEQAKNGLRVLAEKYNLATPADVATSSAEAPVAPANPTVVNNYYYTQGPPVITYYAPPPEYVYLYTWVPYPVWWFGFWWPGFYICNDFTTVIVVRSHPVIVTNHIVIRDRRTVAVVHPVMHDGRRSTTVLRTPGGDTFRTFFELRKKAELGLLDQRRFRPEERRSGSFGNPAGRTSAERIYRQSITKQEHRPAVPNRIPTEVFRRPGGDRQIVSGNEPQTIRPQQPSRELSGGTIKRLIRPRTLTQQPSAGNAGTSYSRPPAPKKEEGRMQLPGSSGSDRIRRNERDFGSGAVNSGTAIEKKHRQEQERDRSSAREFCSGRFC